MGFFNKEKNYCNNEQAMKNNIPKQCRVSSCCAAGILAVLFLFLASCSDHWDDFTPTHEQQDSIAINFNTTIVGSRTATRANNTLVNRLETHFPALAVGESKVGLFGTYTGQKTWAGYKTANSAEPVNNLFYNQPADIASLSNGTNTLSYSPLRFWPNTIVTGALDPSQREYCSFWAYYPYNASADPGANGIAIVPVKSYGYAVDKGMGSIKFTMQSDAADQIDFMISELEADCSRTANPLVKTEDGYEPTRVPLTFHHMLAQVRLYTIITGADKIVYSTYDSKNVYVKSIAAGTSVTLTDGTNDWVCSTTTAQIKDAYGNDKVVEVGEHIPDDTSWLHADLKPATAGTVRWKRTAVEDKDGNSIADLAYSVSFNNIHTTSIFTPSYNTTTGETTFASAVTDLPNGSATVNNYIPNPYWFTFNASNHRVMLNDNFIYDYFDESPSNSGGDSDALHYLTGKSSEVTDSLLDRSGDHASKHYNYAPGNIILAVPQVLTDDDVPNVVVKITGKRTVWNNFTSAWEDGETVTAKVTVNLLNMSIKWESSFIYCYAFLDELMPGDDKVRGPETITVVFDPEQHTDQW